MSDDRSCDNTGLTSPAHDVPAHQQDAPKAGQRDYVPSSISAEQWWLVRFAVMYGLARLIEPCVLRMCSLAHDPGGAADCASLSHQATEPHKVLALGPEGAHLLTMLQLWYHQSTSAACIFLLSLSQRSSCTSFHVASLPLPERCRPVRPYKQLQTLLADSPLAGLVAPPPALLGSRHAALSRPVEVAQ